MKRISTYRINVCLQRMHTFFLATYHMRKQFIQHKLINKLDGEQTRQMVLIETNYNKQIPMIYYNRPEDQNIFTP